MITIKPLTDNAIEVHIIGKIDEADITKIGSEADRLIAMHGSVRVLGDATRFEGWADMNAAKKHFTFVREHQKKVDRIALIAGYQWQHWIAGIMSVFVHPEVKVFDKGENAQAENWLLQRKAA